MTKLWGLPWGILKHESLADPFGDEGLGIGTKWPTKSEEEAGLVLGLFLILSTVDHSCPKCLSSSYYLSCVK